MTSNRRTHRMRAATGAALAAAVLAVLAAHPVQAAAPGTPDTGSRADAPTPGPLGAELPPGPFDDSFYLPPPTPPQGQPGDIIRWRPAFPGSNAANADAWQVMYLSTNAQGERNTVVGTILVPKGVDAAEAHIVGFGPGTQGPAFKCAPSKAMERGTLYDQPAINDALSAGYAVALTDYEGYAPGEANEPTYIVGRSEGPALLDAVRAAQRLQQAGLSPDAKVALQGYSQGGGAVMWAGEMQPDYAPELDLVGVAGGGVPADLNEVAEGLDGYVGFGFLAFAALGLDSSYPDLKLDSYLNETGRTDLAAARENDCVVELLAKYPFKKISDYTHTDPLPTPEWQQRLAENKLGQGRINAPVFQYHATTDEIVNTPQAEALRATYCAKGMDVSWKTYPSDHLSGIFAGNGDAKRFIADRFAGKPTTPNC